MRTIAIVPLFALLALLAACQMDSVELAAYKAIKTSQVAYDTALKIAASQYAAGAIDETRKDQIIQAAKPVYEGLLLASYALQSYHNAKDSVAGARLEAALSELSGVTSRLQVETLALKKE